MCMHNTHPSTISLSVGYVHFYQWCHFYAPRPSGWFNMYLAISRFSTPLSVRLSVRDWCLDKMRICIKLNTFALIVRAHPYCASNSRRKTKIEKILQLFFCYVIAWPSLISIKYLLALKTIGIAHLLSLLISHQILHLWNTTIDGFSRAVVYLACHNNNRAETALVSEFLGAVDNFGAPRRA